VSTPGSAAAASITDDDGIGPSDIIGRPPVDWLITGEAVIAELDAGSSMRAAARMAGVSPRTVTRVFWACGRVIGQVFPDPTLVPELAAAKVHAFTELATARAAVLRRNRTVGPETFSLWCGLNAQQAYKVWHKLDELMYRRGHDNELPGGMISKWGVNPDRDRVKVATGAKPGQPYVRKARPPQRSPRFKGIAITPERLRERYIEQRHSIREIARDLRISPSTLQRRMADWGIERRAVGPTVGKAAERNRLGGGIPIE
jgi:hypothetical protein